MTETLMRVTWVDYTPKRDDGSDPTVRVAGRSQSGERMVRYVEGCWPHCYIHEDEPLPEADGWDLLDVEDGYETYDGVPVKRLTVRHPKQINKIEDAVAKTWESDVPFYRRATWDYDLSGYLRVPSEASNVHIDEIETDIDAESVDPIEPRVVIGDIEVYDEEQRSFEEMKEATDAPICAVTLHDTYSGEYMLGVVDPETEVEPSDVSEEMAEHWGDHDLASEYTDADISLVFAETEADLINTVIGRIQQWRPDLISGWNWIDFDHEYLLDRAEALDGVDHHDFSDIGGVGGRSTEKRIKGLPAFDQMAAYEDKVTRSENRSSALEYIANEEIGIGKIEAMDVATAYERDRSRLAAYNLLDVQLCAAITSKHAIEEFYCDLGDLTGVQSYDVQYEKRLVDGWIASRADDRQVLPNQTERDIPEPAGGLVLSPSDGVTEQVAVFDLKSLYPSSALTMNISPETMVEGPDEADVVVPGMPEKETDVGGQITEDDINWDDWDDDLPWSQRPKGFSFEKQGIVAEAMEGPFHERERYKTLRNNFGSDDDKYLVYDRKQGAVKVVHNSMYGVMNSDYFRLAEAGMGDAITGISRYVLWRAAEYLRSQGYDVIYGDTDSVLVRMSSYEEGRTLDQYLMDAKGLVNQLNNHMSTVADDLGLPDDHPFVDAGDLPHELPDDSNHLWFFEFEKFYESFLQAGSKKRYAGKLAWKEGEKIDDDADPDVTGFESQRADVPKITAEVQTEVIKRVLRGDGFDGVSEYVRSKIEEIRNQTDLAEIGIPKSIGKPLDEYPNMARVRAAEHSNEHLGKDFGPGDTLWMFYAARTPVGVGGTDVFGIDWNEGIPEGYEVDEEKTIRKAFESALEPILDEVGWTFSEVRSGKQAKSAEESTGFDGDPFASSGVESSGPTDEVEEQEEEDDEWSGAEAW